MMSSVNHDDFAHLKIPLEIILTVTNNFSDENIIAEDDFGNYYNGQLLLSGELIKIYARRWLIKERDDEKEQQFWMEISMLYTFKHKNLVSLVGFCDENGEKIIIIKRETRGSLGNYLSDSMMLTWVRRLEICVGVAHALSYIHYDEPRDFSIIHRNIDGEIILLNDNWEPKLSEFRLSMKIEASQRRHSFHVDKVWEREGYTDPTYIETKSVSHKSDMYSFGIVMFELLCGRKAVINDDHDNKYLASVAVTHYREKKLSEIIDWGLQKQIDPQSLNVFAETAYSCLNEEQSQRPNIDEIVARLEKALELQLEHPYEIMNEFAHLRVSLENIASATNNFAQRNLIGENGNIIEKFKFGHIFKGRLLHSEQFIDVTVKCFTLKYVKDESLSKRFWTEISMLSSLKHKNLVSLIGFYESEKNKIIIYKKEASRSLNEYLSDENLTWMQRLKICVGVVKALSYIHYDTGRDFSVIHCNIMSSNILLDDKWEPKLSGFELSLKNTVARRHRLLLTRDIVKNVYLDPKYEKTGGVTHKSDVYSFGVVLLEVLCGRSANGDKDEGENELEDELKEGLLSQLAKSHLDEMIIPHLRNQMDQEALKIFLETVYWCIKEERADRPDIDQIVKGLEKALKIQSIYENPELPRNAVDITSSNHLRIMSSLKDFEHLKIPLSDIIQATENFDDTYVVASDALGMVYKGTLFRQTLAFKRLHDQDENDFCNEIMFLSNLKHQNIFSLIGFCHEDREMILIFDYPTYGSLETYLSSAHLTWLMRVQICLDTACGLQYLHENPSQRIIHRDLTSDSIQLYENWQAKLRLSGLRNVQLLSTTIFTDRSAWYLDPEYMNTSILTTQSDIYSFGVILFDVLCGSAYMMDKDSELPFLSLVRRHYESGTLTEIIDPVLRVQMNRDSLNVFSMLAYRCLEEIGIKRPKISAVVEGLEKVLRLQKGFEMSELQQVTTDSFSSEEDTIIDIFEPAPPPAPPTDSLCGEVTTDLFSLEEDTTIDISEPASPTDSLCGELLCKILLGVFQCTLLAIWKWGNKVVKLLSKILHGVFQCSLWAIWKWRNNVVNAQVTTGSFSLEEDTTIGISEPASPTDSLCGEVTTYSFSLEEDTTTGISEPAPPTDSLCGEVRNIDHMRIPLTEIGLVTRKADLFHFDVQRYATENKIREVSMAELSEHPRRKSTVFIKSLDRKFGQRTEELLRTLPYVSHENLVKIFGFCDEDEERILVVYEHASNGGLNEYIRRNDTRHSFPWVMRLQICLDAARGLKFLHNDSGMHKGIIHGNIKSSNILINRDGVGMIGDFGLSTNEYNDPLNHDRLTMEYDVYSFGLVLFEVMSGMLTHFKISKDDPQFLPEIVKRGFEQRKLNEIIDPWLKKEFENAFIIISGRSTGTKSINIFARVAYQCFQEQPEDRPTMAVIVKKLEKALQCHVDWLKERQEDEDNSKMDNLGHLKIPFKEIYSATRGFDDSHRIGTGGFGGVYTAELFHVDVRKYAEIKKSQLESSRIELSGYPRRKGKVALKRLESTSGQGRQEFLKEIDVLSGLYHQNLISLVGFCYEYGEMILVYDYASNGSFDRSIPNTQNSLILNWAQRLQICIDAAQGLNYLHDHHIIHRDVKSGNILLGGSCEGIIGDVGLSITINSADSQLIVNPVGTPGYIDPKYYTRGILTKQSDMYSFGVVLLEVLCGRFARPSVRGKDRASLVDMAEHHLTDNQPYQIIAQYLMKEVEDEKFKDSVKTYAAITHECLHSTETHCLTMADVVKQLNRALTIHLIGVENISLEEIMSATNRFSDERVIGKGPSGNIYKGKLLLFKRYIPVAVKRLNKVGSYGEGALLKEVVKLSHYSHENIITIRGFCEEDNEKIIIMDHASNESLDKHLEKSILKWGIRLKISIGAAKGLNHIHSFEEDQKTLHGNIKSSNILLDHDWEATISNFIISKSHGTLGYLDPQSYSGMTKKSDVYSFGVVLFEILSGKLGIEKAENYSHHTLRQIINDEQERYAGDEAEDKKVVFLAWMAARCFEENKLEALIFDDLTEQTDAESILVFSKVAYQCLHKDQEKRPTMALVIQELEKALNIHEEWECEQKLPKDYERIRKMIEHPESQIITKKDLYSRLSSGTRLNNEKVWLSLSKDGKVKELISATMFSYENRWSNELKVLENSRFGTVAKISNTQNLKIPIKIKTQFLSLGIIYGAYLVFKFCDPKLVSSKPYVDLKYKTASGELNSYIAEWRDGEWMMIELCRFRSDNQIFDFEVQLESLWGHPCGNGPIFIDGIEFRPIDNAAHEESVGRLMNAESSVNQDQQSPSDFQEIMKRSQYDVLTMNKQELDKLLSTGVLIDNGEKLFSLSKVNCKKCHMLPAKAVINKSPNEKFTECPSSAMSRFEEVVELPHHTKFSIKCDIETELLSPDTAYACYLVFQLPVNSEEFKCPVKARDLLNKNNKESTIIYLKAPGPADLYRDKRVPNRREDGRMEVRVWEFVYNNEIKDIPMELKLACLGGTMLGLTVCGIEFRPL